ncbi:MAG: RNA-guided endonuclease InsQ/TnpB family protein [Candidatus Sericytochromatia bacterium]
MPTPEQWLWRCQQIYNAALEQRKVAYQRCGITLTRFDQNNELPSLKAACPDFRAVGSQVLQDVMARLDKAMKAFFRRVKNKQGKAGFPRFKARARYDSFTLSQAGWKLEGRHLKIKGVGTFKLRLSRPIEGKIKTVTVRRDNCGGWWVSFSCEVEAKVWPEPAKPLVGIDVGLKHFCVDSDPDSQPVANPRYYRQAQAKLRRQQRKMSRRKKGSAKRRQAVKAVARTHRRIADMRRDFLHKTANHYITSYQEIHIEDLKVSNMLKNRHLSKSISDAGWATFFELLCAKAEEAGRAVVKVAPHGTSQNCSGCGERVPKKLAVRVHRCHVCGLVLDRDVNAARNIQAG